MAPFRLAWLEGKESHESAATLLGPSPRGGFPLLPNPCPNLPCTLPVTRLLIPRRCRAILQIGRRSTGHGTLCHEMLLEDVLNLCPRFTAFGFSELLDPFDNQICDPHIQLTALFKF